jgi:hypothetical protein
VGPVGLEPTTYGLKVRSSAIELEALPVFAVTCRPDVIPPYDKRFLQSIPSNISRSDSTCSPSLLRGWRRKSRARWEASDSIQRQVGRARPPLVIGTVGHVRSYPSAWASGPVSLPSMHSASAEPGTPSCSPSCLALRSGRRGSRRDRLGGSLMSEAVVLEFAGVTADQYLAVNTILGLDPVGGGGDWPAGLIAHTGAATAEGGLIVFEVWESQESQAAFMGSRLGPALGQAGVPDPVRIQWATVKGHNNP